MEEGKIGGERGTGGRREKRECRKGRKADSYFKGTSSNGVGSNMIKVGVGRKSTGGGRTGNRKSWRFNFDPLLLRQSDI